MNRSILEAIASGNILISDGATGTNLQSRGLESGTPAEKWVLDNPSEIIQLHQDFIHAGSDIILTCTFGATSIKLESSGLEIEMKRINQQAVELAKEAAKGHEIWIGGSVGPTGKLVEPYGPLSEKDLMAAFSDQIGILIENGVDLLVIETQYDITEAAIAVQAARSIHSQIPIVCSFSYDRGTRTMMGVTPELMWESIGSQPLVDVIGINCGRSLEDNSAVLKRLKQISSKPIWFKPNAGLPILNSEGHTVFSIKPEDMGHLAGDWITDGANIAGGCCGTSPAHLEAIKNEIRKIHPKN